MTIVSEAGTNSVKAPSVVVTVAAVVVVVCWAETSVHQAQIPTASRSGPIFMIFVFIPLNS
jgi:hypothetical protein